MRTSVFVDVSLRDRPKGYLGNTGKTYMLAKKEPIPFSAMIVQFIHVVSGFYALYTDADEMNAEMDVLRERLSGMRFEGENNVRGGTEV